LASNPRVLLAPRRSLAKIAKYAKKTNDSIFDRELGERSSLAECDWD